jgi:hypothetical protein
MNEDSGQEIEDKGSKIANLYPPSSILSSYPRFPFLLEAGGGAKMAVFVCHIPTVPRA